MTEFRDVFGFPGYRVGDDGSVWSAWSKQPIPGPKGASGTRSLISDQWKPRKLYFDKDGYLCTKLKDSHGRYCHCRAHVLVLTAFVGPRPPCSPQTRHLDGNAANNVPGNLCWGGAPANYQDRLLHGTAVDNSGELHGMHKLTEPSVQAILALQGKGFTQAYVASQFAIARSTVGLIWQRKSWKHLHV